MKLRLIRRTLRRWAWLLTLVAIIGGVAGYAISSPARPVYRSTVGVAVRYSPLSTGSGDILIPASEVCEWAELLVSYAQADTSRLLTEAANSLQIDETADIELMRNGPVITLSIDSSNRSTSERLASELADMLIAESQAVVPRHIQLAKLSQIPASHSTGGNVVINTLLGSTAGLLALGVALLVMEYLDASLRWEGKGEQSILELPVLCAVPQVSKRDALLSGDPLSPVAESMRALRTNIFLACPDRPFGSLLLTSPGSSEGKSFILANLAVALASAGNRVIAVDADMRRPSLHELFDRPNVIGLADVVSDYRDGGGNSFSVPLQETGLDSLLLLSAGRPPADPALVLTSWSFPALLEFLRDQGDVILIDSPPVLGPPDATVMANLTEATILVVSVGVTRRELVQQARDRLLAQRGVNLLGLALNRVKVDRSYGYWSSDREEKLRLKRRSSDGGLLTLSEAARRLGISKDQARRWCEDNRLSAIRRGLWWRIDEKEIKRVLEDVWEIKTNL